MNFAKLQRPFKSSTAAFKHFRLTSTALALAFDATTSVTAAKEGVLVALQTRSLPTALLALQPFHQAAILAGAIAAIIEVASAITATPFPDPYTSLLACNLCQIYRIPCARHCKVPHASMHTCAVECNVHVLLAICWPLCLQPFSVSCNSTWRA